MCGEKMNTRKPYNRIRGSPPRVRGKAVRAVFSGGQLRITPACAGKSHEESSPKQPFEDHPRVCGEKVIWVCSCCIIRGSPPRVRGKDFEFSLTSRIDRITPACAGKRG